MFDALCIYSTRRQSPRSTCYTVCRTNGRSSDGALGKITCCSVRSTALFSRNFPLVEWCSNRWRCFLAQHSDGLARVPDDLLAQVAWQQRREAMHGSSRAAARAQQLEREIRRRSGVATALSAPLLTTLPATSRRWWQLWSRRCDTDIGDVDVIQDILRPCCSRPISLRRYHA